MTKVFQIIKRCYQHIKINYNKYLLGAFGLLLTVQAFADDYDIDLSTVVSSTQDLAEHDVRKLILLGGGITALIGCVWTKSIMPLIIAVVVAIGYGFYLKTIVS